MRNKILMWLAVIFVIYYVFNDPAGAAALGHKLMGIANSAGQSLATFFNGLGA